MEYERRSGPVTNGSVFENVVYIAGQIIIWRPSQIRSKGAVSGIRSLSRLLRHGQAPIFSASGSEFLGPSAVTLGLFVQGTMPVSSATIVYKNFSVVYGSDASLPNVVSGVPGGSASNPEELPANNVDEITGSIGTDVPESFFRFHWNGGAFEPVANLTRADPSSTYEFELLGRGDRRSSTLPTTSKGTYPSPISPPVTMRSNLHHGRDGSDLLHRLCRPHFGRP